MAKTTFKKCLALIICVVVFACNVPFTAFAEKSGEINLTLNTYANTALELDQPMAVKGDEALIESINTQLKNYNEQVDIYKFKIRFTSENQQKIVDILSGGLPECFHIAINFSISILDNYISAIRPTYIYSKAEYKKMLAECEDAADKMLQNIEGNKKLTDVQKLLLLHDRIALNCEYDYERYLSGNIPLISHSMYGALVNGVAVCQGYALAYSYLLDRIGIENYYCGSELLYHAWNIVYVNNKPYHVDITWDDNPWDVTGKVTHENFLVSTDELIRNGHYVKDGNNVVYDYDDSPVDTTYDDCFWEESEAAFTYLDGEIYYIYGKDGQDITIKRYSDKKTIYTEGQYWRYEGNFARLDTDGKNLLFSLNEGIYKLDIKTGKAAEVYKPKPYKNYEIYGFKYDNGMLIYDFTSSPNFDINTKKLYEYKEPYVMEYTPGDIDDSNGVNLYDVVVLARAVAGWDVYYNTSALDVNGDGYNDATDVNHLAKYVAGWQGIELK